MNSYVCIRQVSEKHFTTYLNSAYFTATAVLWGVLYALHEVAGPIKCFLFFLSWQGGRGRFKGGVEGGVGEGKEEGEGAIVGVRARVTVLQATRQEEISQLTQALCLMGLGVHLKLLYKTGMGVYE